MNKKLKISLIILGYLLLAIITVIYLDSLTGDSEPNSDEVGFYSIISPMGKV